MQDPEPAGATRRVCISWIHMGRANLNTLLAASAPPAWNQHGPASDAHTSLPCRWRNHCVPYCPLGQQDSGLNSAGAHLLRHYRDRLPAVSDLFDVEGGDADTLKVSGGRGGGRSRRRDVCSAG